MDGIKKGWFMESHGRSSAARVAPRTCVMLTLHSRPFCHGSTQSIYGLRG